MDAMTTMTARQRYAARIRTMWDEAQTASVTYGWKSETNLMLPRKT